MRYSLLIIILIASFHTEAQLFQVGHLQKTFIDSARNNRAVSCEIYYPADQTGDNIPLASGKFPVIAFGHGFVMPWSVYNIYWQRLVPEGFILIFPTTEGSFSPSHLNFGKDLAFAIRALKKEGMNSASAFSNHVDSLSAVAGHSMGGGSALIAMQEDPDISVCATMAAAETNPSAISASAVINRPALLFSGVNDCVTPPSAHQIPMFEALSSTCKSLINITGGNHCQFASSNINCSLGQATCSPQATINAVAQQNLVFAFLLPWFKFYLKNNCDAGTIFQALTGSETGISAEQNCSLLCSNTGIREHSKTGDFGIFPNPVSGDIVEVVKQEADTGFSISDLSGKILTEGILSEDRTKIDVSFLKDGIYRFRLGNRQRILLKVSR